MNNDNDITLENNPREFSRAGLDRTNEVMLNESINLESRYFSKLMSKGYGSSKISKNSKILMTIWTLISILAMWSLILYMSVVYSERGGFLWGWWFCFTLIGSFLIIEPLYLLGVSILLFKRKWERVDII